MNKKTAKAVRKELENVMLYFTPMELEDTLHNVFQEANLYTDYVYDEKEKRKMLHDALRKIFRKISRTDFHRLSQKKY